MKKLLKFLITIILSGTTTTSVVACNHNENTEFKFKNLIQKNGIKTITKDKKGNLYYAVFDMSKLGEKIWKYDIETKTETIYWENNNFQVGSFNMAVDNKGNVYLTSSGGVQILNNKNQFHNMPLVSGKVNDIFYFKNNIYVTTFDGFYKYNIDTKNTEEILLPNNSIATSIFIDKNENIYLGVYKGLDYGALIIKRGNLKADPIIGDDFFNTYSWQLITQINNCIYFGSVDFQTKKIKLYMSLNNNNFTYLRDLPDTTQKIFNINNKLGLIINENENTIFNVINSQLNLKMETKYKIKKRLFRNLCIFVLQSTSLD